MAHTGLAIPGVTFQGFGLEKDGSTPDQYEDAYDYRIDPMRPARLRVAIADGATEAVYSGRWARILAQEFVRGPGVTKINRRWLERTGQDFQRAIDFASLPWYLQDKASDGSFATLLGITVDVDKGLFWGTSVGDSCAVIIVDDTVNVFPAHLSRSIAFGSSPYLIGSNSEKNNLLEQSQDTMHRRFTRAGYFSVHLMTDAFGHWFIREMENGKEPWLELGEIETSSQFPSLVTSKREIQAMRNDDVTYLRLTIDRRPV